MSGPKTVAIVGSRDYPHLYRVVEFIWGLPEGSRVVSGGADGVDSTAAKAAKERGLEIEEIPVTKDDWARFGKFAGPRRNARIVAACDELVAFWSLCKKRHCTRFQPHITHGTDDAMGQARAARKVVIEVPA